MKKYFFNYPIILVFIFFTNLLLHYYFLIPLDKSVSTPDSITYRYSATSDQIEPYLGNYNIQTLSSISLIGESVRPWPFNLINKVLNNDTSLIIFSIILSSLAITLILACVLKFENISKLSKIYFVITTFLFFYSFKYYLWNKLILTEAFVNSLTLIFIGLMIILYTSQRKVNTSKKYLILEFITFIAFSLVTIQRPIVGFSLFITFYFLLFKKISFKKLIYFSSLILFIYVGLLNKNISLEWKDKIGTNIQGTTLSHLSDLNNPKAIDFVQFMKQKNIPGCLINEKSKEINAWQFSRTFKNNCPDGLIWLENDFYKSYFSYLLNNGNIFHYTTSKLSQSLSGSDYSNFYSFDLLNRSIIPKYLNYFFWNELDYIFYSKMLFLALFIFTFTIRKSFLNPTNVTQINFFLTILIFCFIHVSITQIFMPDDYGRLGYPSSILFNLILLYLPIYFGKIIKGTRFI